MMVSVSMVLDVFVCYYYVVVAAVLPVVVFLNVPWCVFFLFLVVVVFATTCFGSLTSFDFLSVLVFVCFAVMSCCNMMLTST